MERKDFYILNEPFSHLAYQLHLTLPDGERVRFQNILELREYILATSIQHSVFFKDCFSIYDESFNWLVHDPEFLCSVEHTFLIRHPRETIPSFYYLEPELKCEAVGFDSLCKLFEIIKDITQKTPTVIDTEDLIENPKAVICAYCSKMGIPDCPDALSWEPGHRKEWHAFQDWHIDVANSSNIKKNVKNYAANIENTLLLQNYYNYHLPFYEYLYKYRLKIDSL
jgi:hypothetical protein